MHGSLVRGIEIQMSSSSSSGGRWLVSCDTLTEMSKRAHWTSTVEQAGAEQDDDTRFWLEIPPGERAAETWKLSLEVFELAERNGGVFDEETGLQIESRATHERRLPRTAFSVTRR